jgi:hypothetical protein
MKRIVIGLCTLAILVLSGWAGLAVAGHKTGGPGTFKPVKIVQGTLKGVDLLNETITVEIVKGQKVTLKVDVDALDQVRRNGKVGERVELRLDAGDIVQTVAVGTGP